MADAASDFSESLDFRSNLKRRVQNLALGPKTPSNALVPVYEAIYNAIHAIQDRFVEDWAERGRIEIRLLNFSSATRSIEIRDNGIGLNEQNFDSFRTYDSDEKAKRGGKGVGRLSWLKVFERAEISSIYEHEGKILRRSFHLVLDNDRPIQDYKIEPAHTDTLGTTIVLRSMRTDYSRHVPTRVDTILRKLVGHFLPYLVATAKPNIILSDEEESYDLASFLGSKEVHLGSYDLDIGADDTALVEHNLLERGVIEGDATHKLYIAAHGRVVSEQDIGLALGLKTFIERDGYRYVYAGVVSGPTFDEAVNAERTAFDIDPKVFELITRSALGKVKDILAPQIERVIEQQTQLTRNVVRKYPRFAYMVDDPKAFVQAKVPRNMRTAEQIYQQLAIFDYRENRDIERKVEALSKDSEDDEATIQSGVDAIVSRLTNQEFSVLADYTVRRKVILDLLEKRLGYKPDGTMKHHAESALHSFVVPMQVIKNDVHIDRHNLWIIDDKLTYYEHWASDKKIKKIVESLDSNSRPDVLLFGGRTAYHRPGTDQPVVLIEFKKPVRNDYDDDENPLSQIYGYIDELREGRVLDREGGLIQEIDANTPFFCYIVADLTPNLRKWLKMAQINVPLPGGGGYYGYNDDYKAFVQALSYKYVLKDARMRNEAFFKHLGV